MSARILGPVVLCSLTLSCAGASPAPAPVAAARVEAAPVAASTEAAEPVGPPATDRDDVTDVYHGVTVRDPYRWLEADGDARVKAWSAAQNAYSRRMLDGLPGHAAIRARIEAALQRELPVYKQLRSAGGQWFVLIAAPPRQQPYLAVMPAGGDPAQARVLVDPGVLDPAAHTVIDFFVPSLDGTRVAVSLSQNGTEAGEVRVIDVSSGEVLPDRVPRVHGGTAGGDLAWQADGKGFFYTRYPAPGERPPEDLPFYQQVYFHALGQDPARDRFELGELPRIAEIRLQLDAASGRLLASVQRGDGGEFAHYLRERGGSWRRLSDFADQIVQVSFAPEQRLLAVSRRDAPRGKLLSVSVTATSLAAAQLLVPESDAALVTDFWDGGSIAVSARRIYLKYALGGPSFVRAFDLKGKRLAWEEPLEVASVAGLTLDGAGGVLMRSQSFITPAAWYRFDERRGKLERTALREQGPIALTGFRVAREEAASKDGTRVPFSVLVPADAKQDGSGACLATGYGGYGISLEPRYRFDNAIWLEQGVCVVVANLRGGGELGESWHQQGMREHKQNVFDDFAAVLEQLVARGYTSAARLGIIGGSNGGLLMGATLVQRPAAVKAVVSFVGIYDMLREELLPNGAFNVTEFGTVQDAGQFAALRAYSPYHNVEDGARYPAALLLTGENDPRVGPMQTRKMAARLQAASAGSAPILFRSELAGGHGSDLTLNEKLAEKTDVCAFMFDQLGVVYSSPLAGGAASDASAEAAR